MLLIAIEYVKLFKISWEYIFYYCATIKSNKPLNLRFAFKHQAHLYLPAKQFWQRKITLYSFF